MHRVLIVPNATNDPSGGSPSRFISGPVAGSPAVVEPKNRKLRFAPYAAAAIDGHSLNASEFPTVGPSGRAIPKTRTL